MSKYPSQHHTQDERKVDSLPDVKPERRTIAVNLVADGEVETCPFWIGLFRRGDLSAREINSIQSTGTILNKVVEQGVNENKSIMLADASLHPPRYIYLLPNEGNEGRFPEIASEVLPSIKAWNMDKIGIYLAPEALADEIGESCLANLITECVESNLMVDYYLYTGSHGLNVLLNQALNLKTELNAKQIDICVFH